ncbi:Uncharacterised protein [uncultured archaeon]|nr:Uncharacterised protein [uncultured archaeon]
MRRVTSAGEVYTHASCYLHGVKQENIAVTDLTLPYRPGDHRGTQCLPAIEHSGMELFANPGSNNKKKTTHFFKINVIKPGTLEHVQPFIF